MYTTSDNLEYLSTFTGAKFTSFRKAVNILVRLGIPRDVAIATILEGMRQQSSRNVYAVPAR